MILFGIQKKLDSLKSKKRIKIICENVFLIFMFVYSVDKHFFGCHFDVSIERIEDDKCLYSVDTSN